MMQAKRQWLAAVLAGLLAAWCALAAVGAAESVETASSLSIVAMLQ